MSKDPSKDSHRSNDAVSSDLDAFLSLNPIDKLAFDDKEKLAQLYFTQGEEIFKAAKESDDVLNSVLSFQKAIQLDPSLVKAYLSCAHAYLKVGVFDNDEEYVIKSNELFNQADALLKSQGQKMPLEQLWDWGICHYFFGKQSEEAVDLKCAVDKFHEAYQRGFNHPDFLLDYGTTLGELGVTIGNGEMIHQATNILELCLKEQGDNPKAWLRLACAYKILYHTFGDVVYFEKADHSFLAAARFDEQTFNLWYNWGQLLLFEGKLSRDETLLYSAQEKLEKAELFKPEDPLILCLIVDTLINLGNLAERVEFLHAARDHLQKVLLKHPEHEDAELLLSSCFVHLGKYFSDPSYVRTAIDHLHRVMSRCGPSSHLWHGLATAHLVNADIEKEPSEYEKAAKCCQEAIRYQTDIPTFWNDWGVALMKLGDIKNDRNCVASAVEKYEEAIRTFHRVSKGSPDPEWVYNYGCALDFLGEYDNDPSLYERAVAVLLHLHNQYPESSHIRYNLAIAFYHLGDVTGDEELLDKAIENLEHLSKNDYEDDNVLNDLGLACLTLADIYKESFNQESVNQQLTRAEQYFIQAIGAGNLESNYWLACIYSIQENFADAIHFLERAKAADKLPSLEALLENEWLENVKHIPRFKALIAELSDE